MSEDLQRRFEEERKARRRVEKRLSKARGWLRHIANCAPSSDIARCVELGLKDCVARQKKAKGEP